MWHFRMLTGCLEAALTTFTTPGLLYMDDFSSLLYADCQERWSLEKFNKRFVVSDTPLSDAHEILLLLAM